MSVTQKKDLKNLIKLAYKTKRLYAGKEAYKMFSGLPESFSGKKINNDIEIIENAHLEDFAICAIEKDK